MFFRKLFDSDLYIPPKIRKSDLTRSRLLDPKKNAEEIAHIMASLKDCPDGYYSKKDPLFSKKTFSEKEGRYLQYSIIKENKHYYAVYRGKNDRLEIAEGSFGVIKYAQDIESGQFVAVKVINPEKHEKTKGKPHDYARMSRNIQSETEVLSAIHRLPSYASISRPLDQKQLFYLYKRKEQLFDPKKFVIVMDLEKGIDGFNFLVNNQKKLSAEMCLRIAKNMIVAWQEVFAKGILHRDIKPENFLIDDSGQVKLIDFGFAVHIDQSVRDPCYQEDVLVGTAQHMSPELKEYGRYSEKSEVFAMGVCFALIFYYGFEKTNDRELQSIMSGFKDLTDCMRAKDPLYRLSMAKSQKYVDQWIEQVKEKSTQKPPVTLGK